VMRGYMRALAMTTRHPWLTTFVGIAIFSFTIWSMKFLPTGFIPAEDNGRIVLSFEMPPGVTVENMRDKTDEAVRAAQASPEVKRVFVIGGATPIGARDVRKASIIIQIGRKTERKRNQKTIEREITDRMAQVPDMRVFKVNDRGERELSMALLSTDPDALAKTVAAIEPAMRRIQGFANVSASAGMDRPEIRIIPRSDEAARFGVTTDVLSEAVRVGTLGDVGPNLAKFNAGDRQIPIRVQFDPRARGDMRYVESMMVSGAGGVPVPLSAVADLKFAQGPSSIDRYDRVRRITLGADLGGQPLGDAVNKVLALPEAKNLPAGVRFQQSGDAEIMGEVFAGFAKAMIIGIMMVLGVLILLFGSVFQPITIMLSLPLSIGGVVAALLLTNNAVSMPVVIGILMLMGIVTKNAIMLVDFAIEEQARGANRVDAVLDAGHKRARPIVMTTIAMAAGMAPTALGLGDGGEFRAPMAIAVIGGLLVSTVLSLVFVPAFYILMDKATRRVGRLFSGFIGPNEDLEAELAHAKSQRTTIPAPHMSTPAPVLPRAAE
ncbi:MAG: efflux RND transporter permease subunit, partial [Beijerinckiaceae bacterium]